MVWLHHKKAVHLHHKGCTQGGAHKGVHLSQVHQPSKKCTNQARSAPTKQKVHQAKNSANSSVGAAGTAAPPKVHQPKNSTNSSVGAAETAAPPKVHQPSREQPNNNK